MRWRPYVMLLWATSCGDDAEGGRCAVPSGDYVVQASVLGSLCAREFQPATTFFESFTTGTRDYAGMRCSAKRSLSPDGCTLSIDERCSEDAGVPLVVTHLTRYQLSDPDVVTGTRDTYVDQGENRCAIAETLRGTPR